MWDIIMSADKHEKIWRVGVFCSQYLKILGLPSLTSLAKNSANSTPHDSVRCFANLSALSFPCAMHFFISVVWLCSPSSNFTVTSMSLSSKFPQSPLYQSPPICIIVIHAYANMSLLLHSADEHEQFWRVRVFCSHTRRLQQIAISCKRHCYNKLNNNSELLQFSFQCHHEVLKEEDECHLWYWWKGIGSGRSSPDSRWRRFIIVTVVRKSDRSFIGAFLPYFFTSFSDISHTPHGTGGRSGLPVPNLSIAMHFSSIPANVELRFTKNWISLESIVNSFKNFFDTSLPRVVGHEMLFLCLTVAVPSTTKSLLSDDVVRDWGSIQSPLVKIVAGFAFNQGMSTSAIDNSLITKTKAFWALHPWNCLA